MAEITPEAHALVQVIRDRFPAQPVPPYPPLMGLNPPGDADEFAPFDNVPWNEVAPEHLASWGYDISPAIGFKLFTPPHMWNYHVPAFLVGSLLREQEIEITDGFLWTLRSIEPETDPRFADSQLPWWHSEKHFGNYSVAQRETVPQFLRTIRDCGCERPYDYDWEPEDDVMLQRWEDCVRR